MRPALAAASSLALLVALRATAAPPRPPVWPERFRVAFDIARPPPARAAAATLYYDWPGRRNLILIETPGEHTLHDLELGNHSSYYFTPAERRCTTLRMPVGVLPPDWLAGAEYLGRTTVGNATADVWTKADFVVYYSDAASGAPLRWDFIDGSGMNQTVRRGSYAPGGGPPTESAWEPPAYCPPTPPAPAPLPPYLPAPEDVVGFAPPATSASSLPFWYRPTPASARA